MKRSAATALICAALLGTAALLPAEIIRQDFNSLDELNAFWDISAWTTDGDPTNDNEGRRTHSPDNVTIADGILDLKLSGSQPGDTPVCAEITSKRSDFLYGSYRASIKTTASPGAVVGWFMYAQGSGAGAGENGDPGLHEIDVEILTQNINEIYFTLHHEYYSVDDTVMPLDIDPSSGFHEYRWDWSPGLVEYYIDSIPVCTLDSLVPDSPMNIMINHWSGNIEFWGGTAPANDVHMYVDYMEYISADEATGLRPISASANPAGMTAHALGSTAIRVDGLPAGKGVLRLIDLGGRELAQSPVTGISSKGGAVLETRNVARGAYLIQFEGEAGIVNSSIIF